MEIEQIYVEPYENSIVPSINFAITIKHMYHLEAIIKVDGWLRTDDGKIVSSLKEIILANRQNGLAGKSIINDKSSLYQCNLIALLDTKGLEHIEKRRMAERKNDVTFVLNLNVSYIKSKMDFAESRLVSPENVGCQNINVSVDRAPAMFFVKTNSVNFSQFMKINIMTSTDAEYFEVHEDILSKNRIISSSDWINDFAPKLGLGEYFIVEIPRGNRIIEKAWVYVDKAEKAFKSWNSKEVYANCRDAGKLLDNEIKSKFENDPKIKKWKRAIFKFEFCASLDLHEEDIIKEKPEGAIKIGKEETEYILVATKLLIKYAEELIESG